AAGTWWTSSTSGGGRFSTLPTWELSGACFSPFGAEIEVIVRPVLFRWRNRPVWSYPAMLYVGLVFGVVAGDIAAHAAGIDPLRSYIATIILIVPALAGARLLYVAVNWRAYRHNLSRIWDRRQGGYVMYGGLVAVLVSSIPLLRALGLNFGV